MGYSSKNGIGIDIHPPLLGSIVFGSNHQVVQMMTSRSALERKVETLENGKQT